MARTKASRPFVSPSLYKSPLDKPLMRQGPLLKTTKKEGLLEEVQEGLRGEEGWEG